MGRHANHFDLSWTHDLAYVVGLLTSDGNLSPDGRHINLTSRDKELVEYARTILGLTNKIGKKGRGGSLTKDYYVLQFGSIQFYSFLLKIGLTPAKSKTLGPLAIPQHYFCDFVRGCIDGDGNISEALHPESSLIQLRLRISSASPAFLRWLLTQLRRQCEVPGGWIYLDKKKSVSMLCFGKRDSIDILRRAYEYKSAYFLRRKYAIARKYLGE